jgi:hypothetical protein
MARKIVDYTGTVIAPGGAYPYGNIKDDPGGTRINSKSNSDIQQFFQRISNDAGLTLNSLPDNATNGFQFVQAQNILINQEPSGMAQAFGAAGLQAVRMSGMVMSGTTTLTITRGWCFYNGQYVYCPGNSVSAPGGTFAIMAISPQDGLPTAVLVSLPSPITDASHFPYSIMVEWSGAVGIDNLNTDVILIAGELAALPPVSWVAASLTSGWTAGTPAARYTHNGLQQVFLGGVATTTSITPTADIFFLPAGSRPSAACNFVCAALDATSAQVTAYLQVTAAGAVRFLVPPTTVGYAVYLDNISFLTL